MGFSRNSLQPPCWGYRTSRGFLENWISRGFRYFKSGYPGVKAYKLKISRVSDQKYSSISRGPSLNQRISRAWYQIYQSDFQGFLFLVLDIQGVLELEKSISSTGGVTVFFWKSPMNITKIIKKGGHGPMPPGNGAHDNLAITRAISGS